jgi:hypothetical protein
MSRLQITGLLVLSVFCVGCRTVHRNCPSPPKPLEISVTASYVHDDGAVSVTIRR